MALTPEQAGKQAYNATINQGIEKVAVLLKEQLPNLTTLTGKSEFTIPENSPEGDKEYMRMAKELIQHRQITSNGQTITIAELDKKEEIKDVAGKFGAGSLEELVPTEEQLRKMGVAVGKGVQEETGSVGFLGGATVMNALMGLLQWIFSGFEGGFQGLKDTIAGITAENMQGNVERNLNELAGQRPDMRLMLTPENIRAAGNAVNQTVTDTAAGKDTTAEAGSALRAAKPVELDTVGVRQEIKDAVMNLGKEPEVGATTSALSDAVYSQLKSAVDKKVEDAGLLGRVGRFFGAGPSDGELRHSADVIADTAADSVSTTVTNPDFRTKDGKTLAELKDNKELARAVAEQVGADIRANEDKFGLPKGTKISDEQLKQMTDQITEKLGALGDEKLDQMRSVSARASKEALDKATASYDAGHNPDMPSYNPGANTGYGRTNTDQRTV